MHYSALASVLSLSTLVAGHGYVQQLKIGASTYVSAWNPYKDPQKGTTISRITRKFKDNGPVTDNCGSLLNPQHSLELVTH